MADRIAEAAVVDVERVGLDKATPEQKNLLLLADIRSSMKYNSETRGKNIIIPIKTGFAFGMGTAAGLTSIVLAWVRSLGGV